MFESFKNKLKSFFSKKPVEEKIEETIVETKEEKKETIKKAKEITEKPSLKEKRAEEKKEKLIKKQETKKVEEKIEEILEKKQEVKYIIEEAKQKVEQKIEQKEKKLEETEHEGFFTRFKKKFTTTTLTREQFNEFFEKLEMLLLENNVALSVVDKIRDDMEKKLVNIEVKKDQLEQEIKNTLKESILEILIPPFDLIEIIKRKEQGPFIILFFGINGSGKTTTIAKISHLLTQNKLSSVFAAADTFRAASIEQLMKHGEKLGVKVIHQNYGADPAAVAFDSIQYAKAHSIKTVLIDTAGRMHTKFDLLREMEKIVRVTQPDLKIFVAESITGNDATEQAKNFNNAFGIDATILTKADVDDKGGTAISIGHVTQKPILFLGLGQEYKDLHKFDPYEIIANLGLD